MWRLGAGTVWPSSPSATTRRRTPARRSPRPTPTRRRWLRCVASPTPCGGWGCGRATGWRSSCPWSASCPWPCSPAPASARCTPWSLGASPPAPWLAAWWTVAQRSSSRATASCGEVSRSSCMKSRTQRLHSQQSRASPSARCWCSSALALRRCPSVTTPLGMCSGMRLSRSSPQLARSRWCQPSTPCSSCTPQVPQVRQRAFSTPQVGTCWGHTQASSTFLMCSQKPATFGSAQPTAAGSPATRTSRMGP
mmetsp:Transcript_86613/g.253511  ORF Transcript_86613/g.253511 Transcript_86613/m.253511 type:complete len:251 (+) Transcript_86613:324-1076(+)